MIPRFIKDVHFNEKHPENHNIRIPNKNNKMMQVYMNDKWMYNDINAIMNEIMNNRYSDLDEHFDKINHQMSPIFYSNYKEYSDMFENENKKIIKLTYQKCIMVMLNSRDIHECITANN
jgi:hypothetical protein